MSLPRREQKGSMDSEQSGSADRGGESKTDG